MNVHQIANECVNDLARNGSIDVDVADSVRQRLSNAIMLAVKQEREKNTATIAKLSPTKHDILVLRYPDDISVQNKSEVDRLADDLHNQFGCYVACIPHRFRVDVKPLEECLAVGGWVKQPVE